MQCYKQIKLGGCQRYTQVQVYTVFSNHYKVSRRYECITSTLECINPASLSREIFLIKGNPWSCHLPLRSNSTLCLFPCSAISISNKGLESMGVLKLHYKERNSVKLRGGRRNARVKTFLFLSSILIDVTTHINVDRNWYWWLQRKRR